jgi:RimJ/RimL family protein N-acetyltransferase
MSSIETAPPSKIQPSDQRIKTDSGHMHLQRIGEDNQEDYYRLISAEAKQMQESHLHLPSLYRSIGQTATRLSNPDIQVWGIYHDDKLTGGIEAIKTEDSAYYLKDFSEQELTYFVSKEKQERGLATTAVNALIRTGLSNGVSYRADAVNEASARVLRRLKFQQKPMDNYWRRRAPGALYVPPHARSRF